jgi:hypothetical protein
MSSFHHADERRIGLGLTRDTERRPRSRAVLVIAVLAALCWAVLIAIIIAAWSAFWLGAGAIPARQIHLLPA